MIGLEDFFNDVVSKAQRGLGLSDEALALAAGVGVEELVAVKGGEVLEAVLLKLAGVLNLHGPALLTMARNEWQPRPIQMAGLAQFNTVFHDMTVNAYVLWDPQSKAAAAFDTGADAEGMVQFLEGNELRLEKIFITHTHQDHIQDLARLRAVSVEAAVLSHVKEPCEGSEVFEVDEGLSWQLGGLRVTVRSTWGHSRGGVSYVVTGLAHPVAIVGDALFASSMGGGGVSYADALATNRKEIFSLADDTILCPGHGPMTTVAEEKQFNPFYPELKGV